MSEIEYRKLTEQEITRSLFDHFIRHQIVNLCRRKIEGEWKVVEDAFTDDWNEEKYRFLVDCLKNTVRTEGLVYGALIDGKLKGFTSVESKLFGQNNEYLDLSSIHVSEDMRGLGIGRHLFCAAADFARNKSAKKLYISAHSAIESQAFYEAMGCVEAKEYNKMHVDMEPCDCQLEFVL